MVGCTAAIRCAKRKVYYILQVIYQFTVGRESITRIIVRCIIDLVQYVIVVQIVGLSSVSYAVAMFLVIIKRTVGVICRQCTCCFVCVVQYLYIAWQVVLLLNVSVDTDVGFQILVNLCV